MRVVTNNHTYYGTDNAYWTVGISRNTFFRWLKEGMVSDVEYRDCRGWRLFATAQVETIRTKTNHVFEISGSHY